MLGRIKFTMTQWFFCISLVLAMSYVVGFASAGCAEASLSCCPGTNSECIVSDGMRTCYCDEHCIVNSDCCSDYNNYCVNRGENNKL